MTDDDRMLVDRAQNGDTDAFRVLVERSKVDVYRLAYDLTGNRHDAEDLSQDVFVKAYRSLSNFRGDAKWSTWLYRIAVNAHRDHVRPKMQRTLDYRDDLERHDIVGSTMNSHNDTITPDRSAESSMIQERIEQALETLTSRERSVFVLRHYHHLPLKQIAGTLKIAEGSVKAYLFRALQRLQSELAYYRTDLGVKEQEP